MPPLTETFVPMPPGVHIDMPTPREAYVLVRSIVRVLADSSRTLDIIVAEEISARAQLRFLLAEGAMATAEGRVLLRDRPDLRDTDVAALRTLEDGTFGREVVRFLDDNGLDFHFDVIAPEYVRDSDEAYVLRRYRRMHDLLHVLLGLGPAGHEEVLVHAFALGQMGMPSSVAIVALGTIKHMVLERRWAVLRRSVRDAYELGRTTRPLISVRWEGLWSEPLPDLRRRLGLRSIDAGGCH